MEQRVAVGAVALLAALVYAVDGVRTSGCAAQSATARYAVAGAALVVTALCAVGMLPPVILYAALCSTLVSVYGVDLAKQKRARGRSVASLARRPMADTVPLVWTGTAAASSFMLAPYVVLDEQRIASLLVEFCVLATAAIAWFGATAPQRLISEDLHGERLRIRLMRGVRCGLAAILAVGSIVVFTGFENAELSHVLPLQRALHSASEAIWAAFAVSLVLWWTWHARRLARASFPAHS